MNGVPTSTLCNLSACTVALRKPRSNDTRYSYNYTDSTGHSPKGGLCSWRIHDRTPQYNPNPAVALLLDALLPPVQDPAAYTGPTFGVALLLRQTPEVSSCSIPFQYKHSYWPNSPPAQRPRQAWSVE
jgi:hypothetical protein